MKILIHRIVIGKPDNIIQSYLNTWNIANSRFTIITWKQEDIDNLLNEKVPDFKELLKGFVNFGELSDFYRYLIIYYYGGVWIDWDITLNDLEKFNNLIQSNPEGYLVKDDDWLSLCSQHFYLPKKSKYLKDVIDNIISCNKNMKGSIGIFYYTGGIKLRQVFESKHYNINVIDSKQVFTHSYNEIRNNKKGIEAPLTHYWTNSWEENPIQGAINKDHLFYNNYYGKD